MLLQELIEASDDNEATLNLVVRCLIREVIDGPYNPNAFALLKFLLFSRPRLGPHAADSVLFSEATTNIGVAYHDLARWLAAGELTPPGSYSINLRH